MAVAIKVGDWARSENWGVLSRKLIETRVLVEFPQKIAGKSHFYPHLPKAFDP